MSKNEEEYCSSALFSLQNKNKNKKCVFYGLTNHKSSK